jgi:hypothetical protein
VRRALFTFISAVSLLLLLTTLVLWVRGQWMKDHVWLIHGDEGSELIRSEQGRIAVRHTRPNGRTRLTLPRRVSHWACRVGSQLPSRPSRLHWEWRFLAYEGVPAATPGEVQRALASIQQAKDIRAGLGASEDEQLAAGRYRRWGNAPRLTTQLPDRQVKLIQAELLETGAREVLDASWYWEWSFPAWLAAAVTALPPALWVIAWHRRRRIARQGRCPDCGYDLRASPQRCPECGLAIRDAHVAAAGAPPAESPPSGAPTAA